MTEAQNNSMPALGAREAWNQGAEAYIQFVDSGADYYRHLVHGPALLDACGPLAGKDVLDIGCGHGFFARFLARAGANVTGIDISDELIVQAQARERDEPLGITYRRMDAMEIGHCFGECSFDLATGCMSLQDIADVGAVLSGAHQALRFPGGLVFSVPHPCTDPPFREWRRDERGRKLALCLDRYFETGPATCDWNMPRLKYRWQTPFRRFTLSEWSDLIERSGFAIRRLREPKPSVELTAAHPELDDCARMPFFLIFDLESSGPR